MGLSLKPLILVLLFFGFLSEAFASRYFTEIYPQEDMWRVDQFEVKEFELQERIISRTFQYRFEAESFAKGIARPSLKSSFKFTASEVQDSPLWKIKNSWDQNWEDQYADWVEKNLDVDFFVRYNFETDCADVAYALRWIFSRNNGLPAAATLAGTNVLVSHETMRTQWVNLPTHAEWSKDQRFLAALRWLLSNVYTKTLYLDAYPIEIRKETVRPGLIHLTGMGGHTEVFNKVSYVPGETPLEVVSSTLPVQVRTLSRRIYMDTEATEPQFGGLIKFRWPVSNGGTWGMIPKEKMPFYSLEQYDKKLCPETPGLAKCIMAKLGMTFDPVMIVGKLISGHEAMIRERMTWVQDGFAFCQTHDCAPGTQGYEDYGTPSRDKRLANNFNVFRELSSELGHEDLFVQWLKKTIIPELSSTMTMEELHLHFEAGFVSYDPRDTVGARWALDSGFIKESVHRKYSVALGLRQTLIQKAESCRANPVQCQNSKTLFRELSSIEVDLEIRKIVGNWMKYCSRNACEDNADYQKIFDGMWRQSPAPWDSMEERLGKGPSSVKAHILNAGSLKGAGDHHLILDQKDIYTITSRTTTILPDGPWVVDFEKSLKQFISVSPKGITVYDEELKTMGEIAITFNPTATPGVHLFQNGKALVSECGLLGWRCRLSDPRAWLIDLKELRVLDEMKIKNVARNRDKTSLDVLISGMSSNLMLEVHGNELKLTDLPMTPHKIESFVRMKEGLYLINTEDNGNYFAGFYSAQGWEEIAEFDYMDIVIVNSYYTLLAGFSASSGSVKGIMVGDDKRLWREKNSFYISHATGPDSLLVYVLKDDKKSDLYEFAGDKYAKSLLDPTLTIHSTWGQYFSATTKSGEGGIYTFDGAMVQSTSVFERSNCLTTTFMDRCGSEDTNLTFDYYARPAANGAESYSTYYKVGKGSALKIDEVYGYALEQSDGMRYLSFGVNESQAHGQSFKLQDDIMMWIPSTSQSQGSL